MLKLLYVFFQIATHICPSYRIYLSKLTNVFVKTKKMYSSKKLNVFVVSGGGGGEGQATPKALDDHNLVPGSNPAA